MSPVAAAAHGARLAVLKAWRESELVARREDRSRLRVLELAWAKLAGASLAGSVLGGGLVSLVVHISTKGSA